MEHQPSGCWNPQSGALAGVRLVNYRKRLMLGSVSRLSRVRMLLYGALLAAFQTGTRPTPKAHIAGERTGEGVSVTGKSLRAHRRGLVPAGLSLSFARRSSAEGYPITDALLLPEGAMENAAAYWDRSV